MSARAMMAAAMLLALSACGDAARTDADVGAADAEAGGGGPPPVTPGITTGRALAASEGEALFIEKCAMCHREADRVGGMGTFLIAQRDPDNDPMLERRGFLTPDYILASVRNGIGNMPRISRADASDAEIAVISDWLIETARTQEQEGARP